MACPTLEDLFIEHALLIRNDVAKSIQDTDFFIKNLPKEQWVDGSGYQYSYPVYERSLPSTPVSFVDFATVDANPNAHNNLADTGACSVAGQTIDSFGITTRTTSLKKAALNSPNICLDDLRFQWQVMDQVNNITRVLSENSKWVWSRAYQQEYSDACSNKIIAAQSLPTAETWAVTPPTSKLTWGMLEQVHEQLGYNGGAIDAFTTTGDMTPIYAVVGNRYTFNDLKRQDNNTRDDFHWSTKADEMLGGPGLSGIYRGFQFFTIQFPRRWDIVNNAWVERLPYASANATRGLKWEVAAVYKNAAFEDTQIFHKAVMKILVPKPSGRYGQATYNQNFSWAGEFTWRNIPDRECNIDENTGFFRALFAYGVKVDRPDLGFVIRHKRCDIAQDLVACS